MSKRTRNIILAVVGIQALMIIGLLALPSVVGAIPGRYRVALAERSPFLSNITESVIEQVVDESALLPAPAAASQEAEVDISALITAGQQTGMAAEPPAPTPLPTLPPQQDVSAETAVEAETPLPTTVPTATPAPTATPTPVPLPESMVLEGMGVIKQTFNNCGPANLTQVLNWYGNDITQKDVASYLKPNPEDRNVSAWEIADYVNGFVPGLQAIARSGGSIEMVKKFVAAGYPVVVEKGYELPETGWWGHYITIYGYDDAEQVFYTQDTYLGPFDGSGSLARYDEIDDFWKQFNYSFYVVYRPEQEAEVAAILGPDMFDDFAMWQNVAAVAESEVQANPEDAIAWFNMGTALTRMGGLTGEQQYYQGGAQAYDKARAIGLPPRMLWYQFQPYLAYMKTERYQDMIDLANATLETQGGRNVEETFLYLGHARAFQGDIFGAREAYQEALQLNVNFYPAEIALNALN